METAHQRRLRVHKAAINALIYKTGELGFATSDVVDLLSARWDNVTLDAVDCFLEKYANPLEITRVDGGAWLARGKKHKAIKSHHDRAGVNA